MKRPRVARTTGAMIEQGRFDVSTISKRPMCVADECKNPAKYKTPDIVCGTHYARFKRNESHLSRASSWGVSWANCVAINCVAKKTNSRGLCQQHRNITEKYGLSVIQYDLITQSPCEICGQFIEGGMHIDHDHGCCDRSGSCGNCVRGHLCRECNWGLGRFRDSVQILEAAINYINR